MDIGKLSVASRSEAVLRVACLFVVKGGHVLTMLESKKNHDHDAQCICFKSFKYFQILVLKGKGFP